MLDIQYYRFKENEAKIHTNSFRNYESHNLITFKNTGFPIQIDSFQQLFGLLDTFQENRFDLYQREINGFNDVEFKLFLEVCREIISFIKIHFPSHPLMVPLDTIISAFVLYKKIVNLNNKCKTILEIGPGCGYFSFFANKISSLEKYVQVEVCESLYILQNAINNFVFKENFSEYVFDKITFKEYFSTLPHKKHFIEKKYREKSIHIPYWKINYVYRLKNYFDIIMSNANLGELTETALDDYIELFYNVLNKNGYFLIQCYGYSFVNNIEKINDKIVNKGFIPVYFYSYPSLEDCDNLSESLAFFPGGENTKKILAWRDNKFTNIKIIDDYKSGEILSGIRIKKTVELSAKDTLIITSDKENVIIRGIDIAKKSKCKYLLISDIMKRRKRPVFNACFIKQDNPKAKKLKNIPDLNNVSSFHIEDKNIFNAFLKNNNGKFYSENNILEYLI